MTRVTQKGYFDTMDEEARYQLKQQLAAKRTEEFREGEILPQGGLPDVAPEGATDFLKQYIAYYKSPERGYHPRSLNSNMGWNITTQLMRLNQNLWIAADEVRTPVLIVHGEKAHSRYFGEEAYEKLTSGKYAANKQLLIVPGATHCDLYDGGNGNFIPWGDITSFLKSNLNAALSLTLKSEFPQGEPNVRYAQYFQGNSYLAPLKPKNLSGEETTVQGYSNVTFEPGCRNNWHIHHGAHQILICVSGKGWYQEWGKPAIALEPGDIIDIPEGVKHWHGAQKDSWFQHIATHVKTGGEEYNEWLEPVNEEEYIRLK
ncbi:MAG: cupin domain-containing protein [Candidatus Cryptobacteroides sp.]